MMLEEVLERAAYARPGYTMASFQEAGLPVYVLTLRILVLERRPLGPIEEAVLRAIRAGLSATDEVLAFLGLPASVLTPVLARLNTEEMINYTRASADASPTVALTSKGRLTLAEAATSAPEERTVRACFDALTQRLLVIEPEQLYRPRDMREFGRFEVPPARAKRPEVSDIPMNDFDRVLRRYRPAADTQMELLSIRRIERRELRFLDCLMVFYRSLTDANDVQLAFWKEDGPALEHENCFRVHGGVDLVGTKLLAALSRPSDAASGLSLALAEVAPSEPAATPVDVKAAVPDDADGETIQFIECHEHPKLLKQALTESRKRLIIVSPWIRHQVVDKPFLRALEELLRKGVAVHIGYGIGADEGRDGRPRPDAKPIITQQAERSLGDLKRRYTNLHLVVVGNTHRKMVVCDDKWAVTTSFNWLSFRGDSDGKPRDEFGAVYRKLKHVEQCAEKALRLLEVGYAGA